MTKESRTHVRIEDRILVKYQKLSWEKFEERIKHYQEGLESPWIDPIRTPGEARKISYHLKRLWEKNRDLAEILEILTLKLDRILLKLQEELLKDYQEVLVNISGAGLRMPMKPLPEVGEVFEFDMVLLPEYHFFRTYGEVVRVEEKEAAFKFLWIAEDDLERLIQHIFKKQLLQIQLSKRTSPT